MASEEIKMAFWVSKDGQVEGTAKRTEVVQERVNAGEDIQIMKLEDNQWRSPSEYGIEPAKATGSKPEQTDNPEDKYEANGPTVFKSGEHFAYAFGKTERERRETAEQIAKVFNSL